jgi:hypothetical protein
LFLSRSFVLLFIEPDAGPLTERDPVACFP